MGCLSAGTGFMTASRGQEASLHLIMSAERTVLQRCLSCTMAGDHVVLLADGVLSTLVSGEDKVRSLVRLGEPEILVLGSDAAARGVVEELNTAGLEMIDEHDLVQLVRQHRHCLSWS